MNTVIEKAKRSAHIPDATAVILDTPVNNTSSNDGNDMQRPKQISDISQGVIVTDAEVNNFTLADLNFQKYGSLSPTTTDTGGIVKMPTITDVLPSVGQNVNTAATTQLPASASGSSKTWIIWVVLAVIAIAFLIYKFRK